MRYLTLLATTIALFIGGARATRGSGDHAFADLASFTVRLLAVLGAIATWASAVSIASVYKIVWPLFAAVAGVVLVIACIGPW
jgi:hypothetical protein